MLYSLISHPTFGNGRQLCVVCVVCVCVCVYVCVRAHVHWKEQCTIIVHKLVQLSMKGYPLNFIYEV